MRFASIGSMAIALLLIAGCEHAADTNYARGERELPMDASAPQRAVREAKVAADAAGIGAAPAAPPPFADAIASTIPTSQVAVDSVPASMLIRTGNASVQVDSLGAGIAAVHALATSLGGYVANTSMQAGDAQVHSATLQLRFPSARFDDALAGLRPIGKLESSNVNTEDVGEEYVDVSAQVANARRLEQRLVQILATRTGKLSDVLAVERELARVRGDIDRQEGRLRYLRAHAAMSTLTVTVHEPMPIVGQQGSSGVMAESFRQAWRNFVNFVAGFIAALGTLVPLAVVLGLLGYAGVRTLRRVKRPTAASAAASTDAPAA